MRARLHTFIAALPLLLAATACLAEAGAPQASSWLAVLKIFLLLLPVFAIFGGAGFYLRHLHQVFYRSCADRLQLELYVRSPLGLPEGTIGAMLRLVGGALLIYFIVVVVVDLNVSGMPSLGTLLSPTTDKEQNEAVRNIIGGISAMIFLVAVIIGAVFYMQKLQNRFFDGCVKTNQIDKFFGAPAGLPEGTVRSVLALMIVVISLFFIVFQFYVKQSSDLPEGLVTLLGAVVAFYFANRASAQAAATSTAVQTQGMREQRDAAVKEEQKIKADGFLGKVAKALQVTEAASALLPDDLRKKYDALAGKLKSGLTSAEGLLKGDNPAGAADLVSNALGEFGRTNPAFQAVAKALPVFTRVLGGSVPALGLVTALAGIGVRIGSARYQRWKLRILQAPVAAASLQIQPIDGLMAERLLRNDTVLERAFAGELQAGGRAELAVIANDLLNLDTAKLWSKYGTAAGRPRFDSQDEFEKTVQAFRRRLTDDQLRPYVQAEWLGPVGTYDALVGATDKLSEDEEARARLDELILVNDGLMSEGQPVLQIMEKIGKEIERGGAA